MSSTKRGGQRSEADWYETPEWCVTRLLEAVALPGGPWMEPAVGDGAIVKAVANVRSDVRWSGLELRATPYVQQSKGTFVVGDFLQPLATKPKLAEVAITNPPFSLAMPFIETALQRAKIVVMLLRLNFIGSEKRYAFMHSTMPDIYVLPQRPPFVVGGGTDSIEYGWFVWGLKRRRSTGRITMLGLTPKAIRRPKLSVPDLEEAS